MHPTIEILGIKLMVFPLILALSFYLCVAVYLFSSKYDNYYFGYIKRSLVYCVIGAGIGGKLIYALTRISAENKTVFDFLGGFVFYGGFLGALAGALVFCIKTNSQYLDLIDVMASLLPLGQSVGRLGCYLNGCCYGKQYDGFLAVRYIIHGNNVKVFPTWFVEAVFCLILFALMFCISRRIYSGLYASIYMLSYSVFRLVLENYRGDAERGIWKGFSTSQYLSMAVIIIGGAVLIKSIIRKEQNVMIIGRTN